MAQLRIGLAQVDPVVGDLPGNADLVSHWAAQAVAQGCHLVAFPEMASTPVGFDTLSRRYGSKAAA